MNFGKDIKNSSSNFGIWELRQRPFEHPKWYDILTSETSWASGAALIIKRKIFEKIGGFDKNIFMYAEDVDLSWKVRMHGYKIKYVPKSVVTHYCYKNAGEIKPVQYFNCIINNLNLRFKYGKFIDKCVGIKHILKILLKPGPFKGSRNGLLRALLKNLPVFPYFVFWQYRKNNRKLLKNFKPTFLCFDYEGTRLGSFFETKPLTKFPLVSVLVRTCGRPEVLRECLISLRNQTYPNIEVVVVEDGKNISEKMIKQDFSDLNIVYKSTNKKIGRCLAGNIAMETAQGKYLNFLDDDDLFYADHIETLVGALSFNPNYKIAYSVSYESKVEIESQNPIYKYKEIEKVLAHNNPFSRIKLFKMNLFPIQSVMFEKSVFVEEGGFNPKIDNLEDWELWARYSFKNKFLFVQKVTSAYKVPAQKEVYIKRQKELDSYYKIAQEEIFKNKLTISPKDLIEEAKNM